MAEEGIDFIMARFPHNVLMLSGYWPVLGSSVIVFPVHHDPILIVPDIEAAPAQDGWVTDIRTFPTTTLGTRRSSPAAAARALNQVWRELGRRGESVGYEGFDTVPASHVEVEVLPMDRYLAAVLVDATLIPAGRMLRRMASVKSEREIGFMRLASQLATEGFEEVRRVLRPGMRESDVASILTSAVSSLSYGRRTVRRCGVHAFAMSGPRAAMAYLPFESETNRIVETGDHVLVHLDSAVDGYWTDITRTLFAGEPTGRQRRVYAAVEAAFKASLAEIREGASCAAIDGAARGVLAGHGSPDSFPHGLGHGIGFKAVSDSEPPVLHPQSEDVLKTNMTMSMSPAVYVPGWGGMRISDAVVARELEQEMLSSIPTSIEWAIAKGEEARAA